MKDVTGTMPVSEHYGKFYAIHCHCGFRPYKSEDVIEFPDNGWVKCPKCGGEFKLELKIWKKGE